MEKLKNYAIEHQIPIIEDEGLKFLLETLRKNNVTTILEIGSAIGYSSINMALLSKEIKIVTLELDPLRYQKAVAEIKRFNLQNQIEIYNVDALEFDTSQIFDFIFIDAAKAQYRKFFEKYDKNLRKDGIMFSDNLDFHGFVQNPNQKMSRNLKQLVRKITTYIEFLKENNQYTTTFYNIGDGIAISRKK